MNYGKVWKDRKMRTVFARAVKENMFSSLFQPLLGIPYAVYLDNSLDLSIELCHTLSTLNGHVHCYDRQSLYI
jgi:hypothetical protein